MKLFQRAANMGNVDAMMYLGVMYASGRGALVDYGAAMRWFRLASDAGNGQAMCNIGLLYFQGKGVVQNYLQAIADAAISGARWVVALDDDFSARLLKSDPAAVRAAPDGSVDTGRVVASLSSALGSFCG